MSLWREKKAVRKQFIVRPGRRDSSPPGCLKQPSWLLGKGKPKGWLDKHDPVIAAGQDFLCKAGVAPAGHCQPGHHALLQMEGNRS